MLESRDGSTGGHVKRTSKYVELIVQELKKQGQDGIGSSLEPLIAEAFLNNKEWLIEIRNNFSQG